MERGCVLNVRHFCSNLGNRAQISRAGASRELPITSAIYNRNLVKLPFRLGAVRGAEPVDK